MSRDRAYSNASSGYGSEDRSHHSNNNTPRRNNNNNRQGGGGGRGSGHNDHHHHHNGGGGHGHHRYHDMTLLCHRVDLFDDFVPANSGKRSGGDSGYAEGLVPLRCLGPDRGCACRTPCTFCHTVIEDDDDDTDGGGGLDVLKAISGGTTGGDKPADINPNLAALFAGNTAAKKAPPPNSEGKKEATTKTTISSTLKVDPIFAQNHGLVSEDVVGGIKVKKYHHPPVGRYGFTTPLIDLPSFFDETAAPPKQNIQAPSEPAPAESFGTSGHADSTEGESEGLDAFFDDFKLANNPEKQKSQPKPKPKKHHRDNDAQVLVFRAPLKTVVKKTVSSNCNGQSGKCLCHSRYENLVKGSTQQNPHEPSVVHDKYWAQRRRLFKKFDEGIQLDAEGWYSVTPEEVADHVATRFADASDQLLGGRGCNGRGGNPPKPKIPPKSMVILDAFCGCGGNAIAFGKLPSSVVSLIICVDVDRTKLRKAAHNASIYNIPPNRIIFVEANSVAVMERCYRDGRLIMDPPPRTMEALSAYPPRELYDDFTIGGIDLLAEYAHHIDAVFMDPPWGGIDYGAMGKDGYDLARDMKIRGCERGCIGFPPTAEVNGVQLLKIAAACTSTRFVAYDLPRNANKRSLAHAALEAGYEGNSKLEEHYLNGRLKTVTAYFGQDFRHLLDLKKYHGGTT